MNNPALLEQLAELDPDFAARLRQRAESEREARRRPVLERKALLRGWLAAARAHDAHAKARQELEAARERLKVRELEAKLAAARKALRPFEERANTTEKELRFHNPAAAHAHPPLGEELGAELAARPDRLGVLARRWREGVAVMRAAERAVLAERSQLAERKRLDEALADHAHRVADIESTVRRHSANALSYHGKWHGIRVDPAAVNLADLQAVDADGARLEAALAALRLEKDARRALAKAEPEHARAKAEADRLAAELRAELLVAAPEILGLAE